MNLNIANTLRRLGVLSYPYLDTNCEFGGKKPGARVKHAERGTGTTLCFAEYKKRDKEYYQRVLFDSERKIGCPYDFYVRVEELVSINDEYGT